MGNKNQRRYANRNTTINYCYGKIVQNIVVIWLDANVNKEKKDNKHTISELNKICNSIEFFSESEPCRQYIKKPRDEQIFLIVSGKLGSELAPYVDKYPRLDTIYVFCGHPDAHSWTKECRKVKLVTTRIEDICKSLVNDAAQCEQALTPISILSPNSSSSHELEQVNASFMYARLIKEILMTRTYDANVKEDFVAYCLDSFKGNESQIDNIKEFLKDYEKHSAIWWYTRGSFAYQMLNHSLRTFDIEVMILMVFFMNDIEKEIEEKSPKTSGTESLVVYRGQGMLDEEFQKVRDNIGGLIAFNSFVTTTKNLNAAINFAERSFDRAGKTAVLFEMEYDPRRSSARFTSLRGVGYDDTKEGELIFSMNTVFQIQEISRSHDKIYNIKLQSVKDDNPQIKKLVEQLRSDIGGENPIDQLGRLMIRFCELEKAEKIYTVLQESTAEKDKRTLAWIDNQFGRIKYEQRRYDEARSLYENALKIKNTVDFSEDLDLATMYNNFGLLDIADGRIPSGLSHHQEALNIIKTNLGINRRFLATTYDYIGIAYHKQGDFSVALSYYQKALSIYEEYLKEDNHPSLTILYQNIGRAQMSMQKQMGIRDNLQKDNNIQIQPLLPDNFEMASATSGIGDADKTKEGDSNALKYYEEVLDMEQQVPHISSTLAMTYYVASKMSKNINLDDKAIEYAQRAVEVAKQSTSVSNNDATKYKKLLRQLQTK